MKKLQKLVQLGTPDALATLIILGHEVPTRFGAADRVTLNALIYRTLVDLMRFTPFYELGGEFYEHITGHYLSEYQQVAYEFPPYENVRAQLRAERAILRFMYGIGLVDNSYRRQHNLFYWLRQTFMNEMYNELVQLTEYPPNIFPDDALYQVLQKVRLAPTRFRRPVQIPYQDRDIEKFKIGNALEIPTWARARSAVDES